MGLKNRLSAAAKAFGNPELVATPQNIATIVDDRLSHALSLGEQGLGPAVAGNLSSALLQRLDVDGNAWKSATPRWDRVRDVAQQALTDGGVTGGKMLEIGGRYNPRATDFPAFEYTALDLEDAPGADIEVMAGDITKCPHIPDNSYDFIFSFDVFEHIDRPWLAAREIKRILKPGGVTVHSTLFAWRYHPCPIDYWRYTAEGLKSLFKGLETLHSDFDYTERRRDVRGQGKNAMTPDAFGGWRENVRVNYAGKKRIR